MNYTKEEKADSPYVSVNTLIKPKKKHGSKTKALSAIMPKLINNRSGDPVEREADQVVQTMDNFVTSNEINPSISMETATISPVPDGESVAIKKEQVNQTEDKSQSPKVPQQIQRKSIAAVADARADSSAPPDFGSQINSIHGKDALCRIVPEPSLKTAFIMILGMSGFTTIPKRRIWRNQLMPRHLRLEIM